jgi:hypothetical protein
MLLEDHVPAITARALIFPPISDVTVSSSEEAPVLAFWVNVAIVT